MKPTKSVHVLHDRAENSREEHYQLMKKIHNVAFFGFADAKPDSPLYKEAFEVAKVLASQGMTIVDGGGPGVMDAATKGAQAVRGETIAVTFYPQDAPGFEGRYVGNIAGTEIITQNYIERMFKLMEHGDAYVIFNGGTGTISELGTAWVMARLYYGHHKPFILFGKFWHEIIRCLKTNLNIDDRELDVFEIVEERDDILRVIQEFEKKMGRHDHAHCEICAERAFMT